MRTTSPCRNFVVLLGMISLLTLSAGSVDADEPQEHQDKITSFNVITGAPAARSAWPHPVRPPAVVPEAPIKRSVGSALSPTQGIGPGESVALTFDDAQYTVGQGRHIAHSWNESEQTLDVHFGYSDQQSNPPVFSPPRSGYNVYNATVPGGDWPRGPEDGCRLQSADELGWGGMPSLDILGDGLTVIGATSAFFRNRLDGTRLVDNALFYQWYQYGCTYIIDPPSANVTWIDSTAYRPHFLTYPTVGIYSRDPQVVTQWDGSNTIVHLLLGEDSPGATLTGTDYCDGIPYFVCTYFRKVGDQAAGTWSAGQTIDSLWFPWASMAASPVSGRVAITYTNPTSYACQLENPYDLDVWMRESQNYGMNWGAAQSITNYTNALEGDPNHFTAWLETQAFYSTDDYLHVIWTAKPTSANPYFDGFDWESLDQNLYHWSRSSNEIVKVANGTFPYIYSQSGASTLAQGACGFGGSNAGYIANINISECNGKLFCVWNQIHERANRYPWRDVSPQPTAGVLDDCAYTDEPMARANWEILMSVARIETSSLWDMPRNVTNTYTPYCGLPDDPERPGGLCGSEYKPSVEKYALDETGLTLYWPSATLVDLTPAGEPPYSGSYFLNMQYLDDQFPGSSMWGEWQTQPRTWNSIKWLRLACVEPVEAAEIAVFPSGLNWPIWVKNGSASSFPITVVNEGNVVLNVIEIGRSNTSWLNLSEYPSPGSPFQVTAGVVNTGTFDITINAAGFSQPTWLDGLVWLKSDAANADSLAIPIHILAADTVELVFWDTVMTHQDMYSPWFGPVGACVGLAVGNNGELGWGARSDGRANLDYTDATPNMPPSRRECDTTRAENRTYLLSSTPYVILASNSSGSGAVLTQVYKDRDQADPNGFDPTADKGSMTGTPEWYTGDYDSVYTGKFVNRDTTIALERIVYAPRSTIPATDTINFVIVYTKVYSADGAAHNHLTIGNAIDWDVPSDVANHNSAGIYDDGHGNSFVYIRGTDTSGHDACSSHEGRYATEAFGGGYTSAEWQANDCVNNSSHTGSNAVDQLIMVDTTHMRDGTPLDPWQPNPILWWQTTAIGGLNVDPIPDTGMNLALFTTYKHDYSLGASDTLHYWTVLTTTPIGGTLEELKAQVLHAKNWFRDTVRQCAPDQEDDDGDGIPNGEDNCPTVYNDSQSDWDEDGVGNACDNCLPVPNTDQADADGDNAGDVCDFCTDTDYDEYGNPGFPVNTCPSDNCPTFYNPEQTESDADGLGDECDNCPSTSNPGQTDADGDGIGDACDLCTDFDRDGFGNPGYPAATCPIDNCPAVANPSQADTDGDGIGDACDGGQEPADSIPFAPQVTYPTGDSCTHVLCLDLDGDQDNDLVTANLGSDSISVLWNVGGALQPKVDYAVGNGPTYIRAADLDADSDLDLAITNWHAGTITILKNDNNAFVYRADFNAGGRPISLSIGDVDGDGDPDIGAAIHWEKKVNVLVNNGNGIFSLQTSFSVPTYAWSAELVDIDGDGDRDIVTACEYADLRTFINDGTGSFTAGPVVPAGNKLRWPTCVDVDRDNDIDVLVPNVLPWNSIVMLLNNGSGGFAVAASHPVGSEPVFVSCADLDRDGHLDIAAANAYSDDISVLRGNGDGTFRPQTRYVAGDAPHCVVPGDLDNDGDLDLIAANCYSGKNISILENLLGGCCAGRVGDANMSGEPEPDEVTLGDIMLMVDVKFISGDCSKLPCVTEADVNQDGGANPSCDNHVTLGDIMRLVDFLFITNAPLPECL